MKNSLKTLRIALVSTAIFSVFSGNAQAENLTFSGNIVPLACTLGIYKTPVDTVPSLDFKVPDATLTPGTNPVSGGVGATFGAVTFYIKVPPTCVSVGTTGKFNVGLSATTAVNGRVPNGGTATNVQFDFVSQANATTQAAFVNLPVAPPANSAAATAQTGWGELPTATGVHSFNVRYYKTTGVNIPVTAGTVTAQIVATAFYP